MIWKVPDVKIFLLIISVVIWTVRVQTVGDSQPVLVSKSGTTVTFKCYVFGKLRNDPVTWFKQKIGQIPQIVGRVNQYIPSELLNEFNNTRFHLSKGSASFQLSISNLLPSDEGFYFCGIITSYTSHFENGTYLIVKDDDQLNDPITAVIQAPESDPVHPGDSETLKCVVLAETRTKELSVFWFRPTSGDSHPGLIYTNKSWSGPCEGRCVYSLSKKDVNISDAGTYYCGIATGGQILFGNGTTLVFAEPVNVVLVGMAVALGCCVVLVLFLAWLICRGQVYTSKMGVLQYVRDDNSDTRKGSDQTEPAGGLNYAALNFSKKETRGRRTKMELPPDAVYSAVHL